MLHSLLTVLELGVEQTYLRMQFDSSFLRKKEYVVFPPPVQH